MKQITITGRLKEVPIAPYRIDWNGPFGSNFSEEVIDFLYPFWRFDVVLAEWPVVATRMRYDFVNLSKRIICETDGIQHEEYSEYFHGSLMNYREQIRRDLLKDKIAELNGFKMIRIKPSDLPLSKEFFKSKFDIDL